MTNDGMADARRPTGSVIRAVERLEAGAWGQTHEIEIAAARRRLEGGM
jgi:hypothetical protein